MTEELVIMRDRQAVTTSLQVAQNFKKRHDHILRDIDAIKKDVPDFGEMFIETMELDRYGRGRRIYYMNRDGFSLLAMGFTGKKALQFKLKYIDAFNQSNMALAFSKKRNAKIINVLGGKKSNAYRDKNVRAKTYRALFSSYRETFDQDRYNDLPMKDFDKAVDFVNNWYPPFELQQEIRRANAQIAIV